MKLINYFKLFGYMKDVFTLSYLILKIKSQKVLVLDLDNTLIDTGYKTLNGYSLEEAYHVAEPLSNMITWVKSNLSNYSYIIILTARKSSLRNSTNSKILEINKELKIIKIKFLIMVPSMTIKYYVLKLLSSRNNQILFIDDLSGGHELGNIIWHEKIFNKINSIKNVNVFSLNNFNNFK